MNKPIQLLLVEDCADDATLLLRQLQKGKQQFVHERVDSAAALARALDRGPWDLIICDFSLPSFSGLDALAMVKERGLDIPFILISGAVGEETAVTAMKAGAHDFILKGQPARLLPAVERELKDAESRRAQRRAEKELESHRGMIERANRELERKNRKLAELYSTAQRFVDNVSHEFRTPLTVIQGYAQAMLEGMAGPIAPQQSEFLGLVVDRTRELAQMVEDLLDTSKLRAGTLRVERKATRVPQIIDTVRPTLARIAAAKNVRIVEQIDADLPDVFVDAEKAGRVVINLFVNAVKYSPEGSQVTLWARADENAGAEIGVTDEGPGIAPENLEVIFKRFTRVGEAQSSGADGIGLGLNIAEELVAINLGTIQVKSELGKGSTFWFSLPPDVPAEVVRRHLAYLSATSSPSSVAAIRVSVQQSDGITDELRSFIASAINPLDLILDTPGRDSLLIVGASADPQGFSERLQAAMEAGCGRFGGLESTEGLHVEHVGSWDYPADADQAIEHVLEALTQEALNV